MRNTKSALSGRVDARGAFGIDAAAPGRRFLHEGREAVLLGRTGDGRYAYVVPLAAPDPRARPRIAFLSGPAAQIALGTTNGGRRPAADRRGRWARVR